MLLVAYGLCPYVIKGCPKYIWYSGAAPTKLVFGMVAWNAKVFWICVFPEADSIFFFDFLVLIFFAKIEQIKYVVFILSNLYKQNFLYYSSKINHSTNPIRTSERTEKKKFKEIEYYKAYLIFE